MTYDDAKGAALAALLPNPESQRADIREWFKSARKECGLPYNTHFAPRKFDSPQEFELKYWEAEDRAIAFERERDEKAKAASRPPALPPARPRKATAYVTQKTLDLTMEGAGKAIREFLAPLVKRIAELEATPTKFVGVWTSGTEYPPRAIVTHGGGMWHANEMTKDKPGTSAAWTLCCKAGRDGRSSR
jgi:hypothetical protein